MANFRYVPSSCGGDPIIKPEEGYETRIDHLLAYREGDAIYYKDCCTGEGRRFDIADRPNSTSTHFGLPSGNRLQGFSDKDVIMLSHVTGLSPKDLLEIRDVEVEAEVPKPETGELPYIDRFG